MLYDKIITITIMIIKSLILRHISTGHTVKDDPITSKEIPTCKNTSK